MYSYSMIYAYTYAHEPDTLIERVCTSMYEYVRVCTSMYEYVRVCTSMYEYTPIYGKVTVRWLLCPKIGRLIYLTARSSVRVDRFK